MNVLLSEEQELIGQSAREFAKEHLDPIAAELDRTGAFPVATVRQLAAQDFLGLFLASEFGGAEAGFVSLVEVIENLSRSSAAVAAIVLNHSLAAYAVHRFGDAAQKQAWLPAMAQGEKLGTFTALQQGPAASLVATRQAEGWVLNGAMAFVRNAGVAGLYVVVASTPTEKNPAARTAFLVGEQASGLTVGEPHETMGLKGCPVADLTFDQVVLAEAAQLGGLGEGAQLAAEVLAVASLGQAAQAVGIGQAAVEHAAAYSKTRVQFGRPIAALQAIQTLLAGTATDCHFGRLGLRYAARLLDEGQPFLVEAAMVQQFLSRVGSGLLVDTVQVEGGFGFSEFMPLPRLFRDIAGTTLREAPADLPELTIAAALLA